MWGVSPRAPVVRAAADRAQRYFSRRQQRKEASPGPHRGTSPHLLVALAEDISSTPALARRRDKTFLLGKGNTPCEALKCRPRFQQRLENTCATPKAMAPVCVAKR